MEGILKLITVLLAVLVFVKLKKKNVMAYRRGFRRSYRRRSGRRYWVRRGGIRL